MPPKDAPNADVSPDSTVDALPPTSMMLRSATPEAVRAAPAITFTDDSTSASSSHYSKFSTEIAWLANSGVTTGWLMPGGSREYRPYSTVARDAMAAFLYRYAGKPAYIAAPHSPFADIKSSTAFFTEISWAAETGISKGWRVTSGHEFRPYSAITREAMAAFLYRFAGSPKVSVPSKSPFTDVTTSSQFYKQIVWLASTGATTGWKTPGGAEFRPGASITRDAMAAFLYRLDRAGVSYAPSASSGPLLRHSVVYVYGTSTLNLRSGPSTSYSVVTQRSRGNALTATGAVSTGGWIEVQLGTTRAWGSGYYLAGSSGVAITRAKTSYSNGYIPVTHLCPLSWDTAELLLCQAADDLERLNRAFRARYGMNIPINDAYRTYQEQVTARAVLGNIAAIPGTSNHGWGAAIDVAGSSLPGGYSGAAYLWLRDQLTGYNWKAPDWARPSGYNPEPWHFEYTG
ncbi:D-alanyl-D-alanine carboxypeptidase family protein [Demequina aurantiaca]|uniref:D-alanyl-D-alanine carboxypeptidase family protein n=1 Tax=Demequina aurantiaca TaxID=676200 RepID=UPI000A882D3A|nr:D-alanyl-D-alanine carboxypeptidase family protein [Demequina aurantiaca]